MNKYWFLIPVIVLLCCILSIKLFGLSVEERAQFDTYGFSTLQGFEGVYSPRVTVMARTLRDSIESFVEGTRDELDEACLSMQKALEKEVTRSIQEAGIKIVLTPKKVLRSDNVAHLGIDVTIRKPVKDVPLYAFTVQTELRQEVQLVRDPKIRTDVPTWPNSVSRPNIFFVEGFSEMKKAIRIEVIGQMKQFIEDYLAANPKI